jgi:hypothetical protein
MRRDAFSIRPFDLSRRAETGDKGMWWWKRKKKTSKPHRKRKPKWPPFDSAAAVEYEKRVVVFYDVLGWRSKIAWAGGDAERIAAVQNLAYLFNHLSREERRRSSKSKLQLTMTSFSDNVVISQRVQDYSVAFFVQVAMTQLMAAVMGFWVRGGIAIGET